MIDWPHKERAHKLKKIWHKASHLGHVQVLLAVLLIGFGCCVMVGWVARVPLMFSVWVGGTPVVFTSGLALALCGVSLALMYVSIPWVKRLGWLVSFGVGTLGAVSLVEFIFNLPLGLEFMGLHAWYDYGSVRPGLMAPNDAVGFMLCLASIGFSRSVRSRVGAIWLMTTIFGLFLVGVTGLLGNFLAPEILLGWGRSTRMALPTAAGMLACAAALWAGLLASEWHSTQMYLRYDEMIRLVGTAILMVATAVAGLFGFVLMQHDYQHAVQRNIPEQMVSRLTSMKAQAAMLAVSDNTIWRLLGGPRAAAQVLGAPEGAERQQAMRIYEARVKAVLAEGYRSVALIDASGKKISGLGYAATRAGVEASLGVGSMWLAWDEVFVWRRKIAVNGGSVELDREASSMIKSVFDTGGLGKTGDVSMCVDMLTSYSCLPNANHARPFSMPKLATVSSLSPMRSAVSGNYGSGLLRDDHGNNVYAAYAGLGPKTGLVLKQDIAETYAAVRTALELGALVVLSIAGCGAMLLYSQLSPLARRMIESEREAKERGEEVSAVLVSVADAIVTVGESGLIEAFNPAACVLFGWSGSELKGMGLANLMPERFRKAHEEGMKHLVAGGVSRVIGRGPIEVAGKRKSGTEFAMELSVSGVERQGARRFVGVMRDVSERKAAEARMARKALYDELTKLPNRSSFKDSLERQVEAQTLLDYAVVFLDLDGFKAINDGVGHRAGDEVLAELARRLLACAGPEDTVGRLAGDEFTMLLTNMVDGELRSCDVAGQIIEAVAKPFSVLGGERWVTVTASVGVAVQKPMKKRLSASEILHLADQLMYEAKRAGKNQFKMHILEPEADMYPKK